MRTLRPSLVLAAIGVSSLLFAACGGGDTDPPRADSSGDTRDAGDNGDASGVDDTNSNGNSSAEFDCDQLRTDAQAVGVAIQLFPQLQTPEQIADDFVLGDLDALRASIDRLRAHVDGDAAGFLDDIAAGVDAIESGRTGDPAAAVAELATITGGLEGLQDWLFRQTDLYAPLEATGCELN